MFSRVISLKFIKRFLESHTNTSAKTSEREDKLKSDIQLHLQGNKKRNKQWISKSNQMPKIYIFNVLFSPKFLNVCSKLSCSVQSASPKCHMTECQPNKAEPGRGGVGWRGGDEVGTPFVTLTLVSEKSNKKPPKIVTRDCQLPLLLLLFFFVFFMCCKQLSFLFFLQTSGHWTLLSPGWLLFQEQGIQVIWSRWHLTIERFNGIQNPALFFRYVAVLHHPILRFNL